MTPYMIEKSQFVFQRLRNADGGLFFEEPQLVGMDRRKDLKLYFRNVLADEGKVLDDHEFEVMYEDWDFTSWQTITPPGKNAL